MVHPDRAAHRLGVLAVLLTVSAGGWACDGEIGDTAAARIPDAPVEVQAVSLLGDTLRIPTLDSSTATARHAALDTALRAYERTPADIDSLIWLGRRLAYLGQYHEAIDVYSWGIERAPDDPRLYRHRGHRYLTTRQLTNALGDFLAATRLIADREDEVEPDGLPNARGIPTSTLKTNVWYHLGLTHYLRGDFERAASAYRECLKYSTNPDMDVAATHWLYMALRRLGNTDDATVALDRVPPDADIIENGTYFDLISMYKGQRSAETLLTAARTGDALSNATLAYGIANWYGVEGRAADATDLLQSIVTGPEWAAFGFLAAEADLARQRP